MPSEILSPARHDRISSRFLAVILSTLISQYIASSQASEPGPGNQAIEEYFRIKTNELSDRSLAEIQTQEDWKAHRDQYRKELQDMLGLSPLPERTPLKPEITGIIEKDDFVVEKLHFQSMPGLYVTANLYRPREVKEPLPAILYVCGHSVKKEGNVSFGNKTGYHHHGVWYARNGYVCLTIDTIQLGEIPGIHHGTHNQGMWWWHSRGYTPVGVETWNGIRALDYLQSRAEVDPERIGMTGRSGGGAYTWYVAAMDDRVKVAVPVAGITNLKNHLVDGCIAGHCDCMFQVNSFGWDYPQLAALVSPRPLLISNTDADPIFPLDGVVEVFQRTRRIYEIQGAGKQIGLCIAAGGHEDIQELQNDAFRWMNKHLKNKTDQISMTAEKPFTPRELKVFDKLPADERVTSVQSWFIPEACLLEKCRTAEEFHAGMKTVRTFLDSPAQLVRTSPEAVRPNPVPSLVQTFVTPEKGLRLREYRIDADEPYRLSIYVLESGEKEDAGPVTFEVLDQPEWEIRMGQLAKVFSKLKLTGLSEKEVPSLPEFKGTTVFFAPRGVGTTRWTGDEKSLLHMRRRFMLLGTTLERLQVEDVRNALAGIAKALSVAPESISVQATGNAASWALYSRLLLASEEGPKFATLKLTNLPTSPEKRAQFLCLERHASLADVLADVADHSISVELNSEEPADQDFSERVRKLAAKFQLQPIQTEKSSTKTSAQ